MIILFPIIVLIEIIKCTSLIPIGPITIPLMLPVSVIIFQTGIASTYPACTVLDIGINLPGFVKVKTTVAPLTLLASVTLGPSASVIVDNWGIRYLVFWDIAMASSDVLFVKFVKGSLSVIIGVGAISLFGQKFVSKCFFVF